ncbi:dienelactone hydrolase family protein [soil metagenome]
MDTLSERWAKLLPDTIIVGPDDDAKRPAVILFHGCGGMRPHLPLYAEAAKAAGWRAFIVDSYTPRGWGRMFALSMVCTGVILRGDERAGDVLAAIKGVSARTDVDETNVVVAGWSHGGWGIMELLAAARTRKGELGVADAGSASLDGIRGAFLVYPYIGFLAVARMKPWRHRPRTQVIIARHDHLTTVRNAERVFAGRGVEGAAVETWIAEGTHSFDEPTGAPPMRHDPTLTAVAVGRFEAFLRSV